MTGCPARYDSALRHWVVDDPAQVRRVLLDPGVFRPDNALRAHTPIGVEALRVLSAVGFALPPTLANNAGASHRPVRRTVARFFGPGAVDATEPLIRRLVRERLAVVVRRLDAGDTVDLVAEVAAEPPALVLLELLGLCDVDVPALKRWSRDSLELFWGWPDLGRQLELAYSAAAYYRWLRARTTAARAAPGTDLFGALTRLDLTDEEICGVAYFLLIAGQETTSQLISATFCRVLGRPLPDPAAEVDRLLREASSVPTWRRVTARRTELGDVEVPANAPILLRLTGIDGPADLAFGAGVHRCLGARLARLETRTTLSAAVDLLTTLRGTEQDPPMTDLLSFRAPARLLVSRAPGWPSRGSGSDRGAARAPG